MVNGQVIYFYDVPEHAVGEEEALSSTSPEHAVGEEEDFASGVRVPSAWRPIVASMAALVAMHR